MDFVLRIGPITKKKEEIPLEHIRWICPNCKVWNFSHWHTCATCGTKKVI